MTDFLLATHVLCAVLWAGGGVTLHVLFRRALASRDPSRIVSFLREVDWVGPRFYAPLSIVLLLAGTFLVSEAGYEHSQLWITLAYTGWFLTFIIGVAYYPAEARRREAAVESAGLDDPAVIQSARRTAAVNMLEISIMVLLVIDMTVKPGL